MSQTEIESAQFVLEQNQRKNEEAEIRKHNANCSEWKVNMPRKITNAIIDADPIQAAYLWADENLILMNSESISSAMSSLNNSPIEGYDHYVSCYCSHAVESLAILINKTEDGYITSAVITLDNLD